jgi:hypothetical protein
MPRKLRRGLRSQKGICRCGHGESNHFADYFSCISCAREHWTEPLLQGLVEVGDAPRSVAAGKTQGALW